MAAVATKPPPTTWATALSLPPSTRARQPWPVAVKSTGTDAETLIKIFNKRRQSVQSAKAVRPVESITEMLDASAAAVRQRNNDHASFFAPHGFVHGSLY